MTQRYYTPKEIAERLGVSVRKAQDLISGEMRHIRVGTLLRVSPQAFEAWEKREEERCAIVCTNVEKRGGAGSETSSVASSGSRPSAKITKPRSPSRTDSSEPLPLRVTRPRKKRRSDAA